MRSLCKMFESKMFYLRSGFVILLTLNFGNYGQLSLAVTTEIPVETATEVPGETTTKAQEIIHLDDRGYTWSPGGRHYPDTTQALIISTDPGYMISSTATKCDIDSESGDYLQIKSGDSLDVESAGRVFTFNLAKPRKYLFHSNNIVAAFTVSGKSIDHNGKEGFEIAFTRIDQITTTPKPTTTTSPRPTTKKGDLASHEVDVFGHKDVDYNNKTVLNCFKTALMNMTIKFCEANKIIPRSNITLTNILIEHLMKCPYSWPDSDNCVTVRFKIPIFLADDSPAQGYQLDTKNLAWMWDMLAENYLYFCNLSKYSKPDIDKAIEWWMILIGIVIVVFIILLFVSRRICLKIMFMKRKRRFSDASNILPDRNDSMGSLTPHYLQSTPPLFEDMYSTYKPGEETYAEPIIPNDNSNQHHNHLILSQGENDDGNGDAYA